MKSGMGQTIWEHTCMNQLPQAGISPTEEKEREKTEVPSKGSFAPAVLAAGGLEKAPIHQPHASWCHTYTSGEAPATGTSSPYWLGDPNYDAKHYRRWCLLWDRYSSSFSTAARHSLEVSGVRHLFTEHHPCAPYQPGYPFSWEKIRALQCWLKAEVWVTPQLHTWSFQQQSGFRAPLLLYCLQ